MFLTENWKLLLTANCQLSNWKLLYHSSDGRNFRRVSFLSPMIFFFSMRFAFAAAEGLVARRRLRTRCMASSFSANRSKAASRLADCDRRSVAVTTMPEGRCVRRTPVSTLLRCCPPGPPATKNSISQLRSSDSRSVAYLFGCSFCSGCSIGTRALFFGSQDR